MKQLTAILCMLLINYCIAQNVGIGTNTPNASAALDISSTNKGLLIPRLTTAQRNAIASPANGLMVFDTNTGSYWYWAGGVWKEMAGGRNSNTAFNGDSTLVYGASSGTIPSYNINHSPIIPMTDSSFFLYDSGGPTGPYGNNENHGNSLYAVYNTVFLKITVLEMNIEPFYDSLLFFNAQGDSIKITGTTTGTWFLNTGGTGAAYTKFKSNGVNPVPYPGFKVRIDRVYLSPNAPNEASTTGWLFIPSKMAIRGGSSANWSPAGMGFHSFAVGKSAIAAGDYSMALGDYAAATADYALALGSNAKATAINSTALGPSAIANGDKAIALGYYALAQSENGVAIGSNTVAQGLRTIAVGYNSTSYGDYSTALGYQNSARAMYSMALGVYSDPISSSSLTTRVETDPLLYVGNGTFFERKNALMILKNGNVGINTNTPNAKLEVNGFTNLGGTSNGAPNIKMKKLNGTSAATQGNWVNVAHGLTQSKIIAVNIIMTVPGYVNIPPSYVFGSGYQYDYQVSATNVVVMNVPGNSTNILSKNFTIVITYEE